MEAMTPQQCFDELGTALATVRERTAGLDATYQFHVTGDDGGDWWVVARSGTGEVGPGIHEAPNTTVTVDRDTFVGLATGTVDGQQAFFEGKMKVEGDARLGMYLKQVFGGS